TRQHICLAGLITELTEQAVYYCPGAAAHGADRDPAAMQVRQPGDIRTSALKQPQRLVIDGCQTLQPGSLRGLDQAGGAALNQTQLHLASAITQALQVLH